MATFKCCLGTAVVMMIFTATHGLSIPRSGPSIFPAFMKGTLFRQTRDVAEEDANVTMVEEIHPCGHVYSCIMENTRFWFVRTFLQFDFETVATDIPTICEPFEESDCSIDGCEDVRGIQDFINGIGELLCDHEAGFINASGSTCWGFDFEAAMSDCFSDNPTVSPFDPAIEDLLECFANVPEHLPNCSEEDAQFVVLLTQGMVGVGREAYAFQEQ